MRRGYLRYKARHVRGRSRGSVGAGVAGVTVIDDAGDQYTATVGDEVWVAVAGEAGFKKPLVRFTDAAGELVAVLPDGPRTPVEDADLPCPVCGAVAWVEVEVLEHGERRARVLCECCGLEVGARRRVGA